MHFVAMLAYELGVEVRYDVGQTVLSLLLAVAATAVGFAAVSAPAAAPGPARIGAAGLAMGLGICLMYYVGMAAMRLPAIPAYRARSRSRSAPRPWLSCWPSATGSARRGPQAPWRSASPSRGCTTRRWRPCPSVRCPTQGTTTRPASRRTRWR
jgi:hypothetical protein